MGFRYEYQNAENAKQTHGMNQTPPQRLFLVVTHFTLCYLDIKVSPKKLGLCFVDWFSCFPRLVQSNMYFSNGIKYRFHSLCYKCGQYASKCGHNKLQIYPIALKGSRRWRGKGVGCTQPYSYVNITQRLFSDNPMKIPSRIASNDLLLHIEKCATVQCAICLILS